MLVSLSKYKVAKQFLEDLPLIYKIIDLTVLGLRNFQVYRPVRELLRDLRGARKLLECHEEESKKVLTQGRGNDGKEET